MKRMYLVLIAMVVAPLFAGAGYLLAFFAQDQLEFWKLWEQGKVLPLLLPSWYFTPIAYVGTVLFGLPVYLLLARYEQASYPYVVAAGGLGGLLTLMALTLLHVRLTLVGDALFFVMPGMLVATVAYLIVGLAGTKNSGDVNREIA